MTALGAVVAPAAPEIPLAVIGLGVVCAFVVMYGLKVSYDYSLGALLRKLADVLDIKVWRITIGAGGQIRKVDDYIASKLASGLLAIETVLGKWWHAQEQLARLTWDAMVSLAHSTEGAFDSLVHGLIPTTVETVVRPERTAISRIARVLRADTQALRRELRAEARALEAELDLSFGRAWRGIDALRRDIPVSIARALRGIGSDVARLDRQVGRVIPHRLTRLEKWLGAGVIGGAAIAALTRVFPYFQCSNVKRFMRGVCRSPLGALDWLFALAALVVVALDPERMLQLSEDAADELGAIIRTMAGLPEA